MRSPAPDSICDIGCGKADTLILLHEMFKARTIGIDVAQSAIDANLHETEVRDGLWEWYQWDYDSMPTCKFVEDGSVDVVYSSHVIEHVEHPYNLIEEQIRMASKDGLVVVAAPLHLHHREHRHVFSIEDIVAMMKDYANPVICYVDGRQTEIVAAVIKP